MRFIKRFTSLIILSFLIAGMRLPVGAQGLQQFESELKKLARKGTRSIVAITAEVEWRGGKQKREGKGPHGRYSFETTFSGIVLDGSGHIVTVGNPVESAARLRVSTKTEELEAEVVGVDSVTDIAVIKVDSTRLDPAEFAGDPRVEPGSLVITVGNSYGFSRSVQHGIVSGIKRTVLHKGTLQTDLIQMNAPVNPGDQGGIVLNTDGQCIGMIRGTYQRRPSFQRARVVLKNIVRRSRKGEKSKQVASTKVKQTLKLENSSGKEERKGQGKLLKGWKSIKQNDASTSKKLRSYVSGHMLSPEGIHFAIPASTVTWIAERLKKDGHVKRGWLGVRVRPVRSRRKDRLDTLKLPPETGYTIIHVIEDGPADQAGLKEGDIIAGLNGHPVRHLSTIRTSVFRSDPGDTVRLEIVREDKLRFISVTVGSHPDNQSIEERQDDKE